MKREEEREEERDEERERKRERGRERVGVKNSLLVFFLFCNLFTFLIRLRQRTDVDTGRKNFLEKN